MNERLNNALAALAEKLGTSVDHLWAVLVKQAGIEAWVSICLYAVLIVAASLFLRWFSKTEEPKEYSGGEAYSVKVGIGFGSLFVFALIFSMTASEVVSKLLNPEYWALKEILRSVGQ